MEDKASKNMLSLAPKGLVGYRDEEILFTIIESPDSEDSGAISYRDQGELKIVE